MAGRGDPSLLHLLGRLAAVEDRVRAAVAARRAVDSDPDDAFRGLYLSDEQVDTLLARGGPDMTVPAPTGSTAGAGSASVTFTDEEAASDGLAGPATEASPPPRLAGLARCCGLGTLDVDILLTALAPDLDPRFEKLYGYLHDDVTRRRASIGLALELTGRSPLDWSARARCTAAGPLVAAGLLVVEETDRPFLTRSLRVPDRVAAHLLGDDRTEADLAAAMVDAPQVAGPTVERLTRWLGSGPGPGSAPVDAGALVYLRTAPGADAVAAAASAARRRARTFVAVDLRVGISRLPGAGTGDSVGAGATAAPSVAEVGGAPGEAAAVPGGGAGWLTRAAVREARLAGAALILGPVDGLDGAALAAAVAAATPGGPVPPIPVVLYGRAAWEPETPGPVPLVDDVHPLGQAEQVAVWSAELGGGPVPAELELLRLTPRQVRRAVAGARSAAAADGARSGPAVPLGAVDRSTGAGVTDLAVAGQPPSGPGLGGVPGQGDGGGAGDPDVTRLVAAARRQNATGLERLARRVSPAVGWDDLVLPARTLTALHHLTGRAAHRGRVLDDWGLRRGGGRGEAVTALFVGESGTGKTMAAEVVADDLGVDLYVIDLSTVVDKYIGETEKNLERIFVGAEGLNAVLFFDEADALFGKRSEVSDARDRYANVEVAYLLQRIESFDGVAILATNLAANLDDAFRRRLSVIAEFARPDADARLALWRRMLGGVPLAADVDLEFCAKAFGLAGGDIRNAAVTAAYLGAGNGQVVEMREIVTAVGLEYRKLGRLCLPDEFGPYFELLPR